MGKRKDRDTGEEEGRLSSPKKKHKHKHKKHKRKREGDEHGKKERKREKSRDKDRDRENESSVTSEPGRMGALKLKIKLGGQTFTTKQVAKIVPLSDPEHMVTSEEEEVEPDVETVDATDDTLDRLGAESETSYQLSIAGSEVDDTKKGNESEKEEEEWLNALEAGELDDYGRLKQEKDISTMTARQRAMLGHEIKGENQLLELPTEPRRKNEDTEEAQKRRKQRAKKRKQQLQKQIEENKAQTVKKLLVREPGRAKKEEEKAKRSKAEIPNIRYVSGQNGVSLSYPPAMDFPLKSKSARPPAPKEKCTAQGCSKDKKYNCSTNNLPVCSLECYKLVKSIPSAFKGPAQIAV
ncbi:INO80 complex subunit B isoform X2 [Nematostella vectensis]|uniref:INO80 complex subunit B isoform X2 n=1 Tax=Nematostella vectensis TaxID=45351 RepID=UPI00138FA51E|nr:INO80 complex subunit B isoform X2 [Nematostella vectensis]